MNTKSITKSELAEYLGVDKQYLQKQMNVHYYDDLVAVGYNKYCQIIPPIVVRTFIELYGDKLTDEEL